MVGQASYVEAAAAWISIISVAIAFGSIVIAAGSLYYGWRIHHYESYARRQEIRRITESDRDKALQNLVENVKEMGWKLRRNSMLAHELLYLLAMEKVLDPTSEDGNGVEAMAYLTIKDYDKALP